MRRTSCAAVSCLFLCACGADGSTDGPTDCTVDVDGAEAATDGKLTYVARVEGEAEIASLTYRSGADKVEVKAPKLPFEKMLEVKAGDSIRIVVQGSAEADGDVLAGYNFVDAMGASPDQLLQSCKH